jgi:hypothetical protein
LALDWHALLWSLLFVRLDHGECGWSSGGSYSEQHLAGKPWYSGEILITANQVSFGSFTNLYHQAIHMREAVGPIWDFHSKAGKLMEEAQYAT